MAEWLGKALQKLVQRFESARDLNISIKDAIWRPFLFLSWSVLLERAFKPSIRIAAGLVFHWSTIMGTYWVHVTKSYMRPHKYSYLSGKFTKPTKNQAY